MFAYCFILKNSEKKSTWYGNTQAKQLLQACFYPLNCGALTMYQPVLKRTSHRGQRLKKELTGFSY